MASVSILIVAPAGEEERARRALASARGQAGDPELLLVGDADLGDDAAGVRRVGAGAGAAARNEALAAATGEFVVVVEAHERLAPDAVARHLAALEAATDAVASYGRTAIEEDGRVRLRPDAGRSGRVLARLIHDKHLIASSACALWRKAALGPAPYVETYRSVPALRLAFALKAAQAGEFVFHPTVVAERDAERSDLAGLEELVRVFLTVLYAPERLEEKAEHRARMRLARQLVAIGKHHFRQGDHRRAGKFFDEAVKAAPAYFKGRRYQFMNFVARNVLTRSRA
ncbi:MAG: glycosyltransferase [Planctomycetes bacterium]|nr:glycosyltransferase [Planctomycetota bacterium]